MKLKKADSRDKKRSKKKHGMRVHGKNIGILSSAQEKRDKELLEKP